MVVLKGKTKAIIIGLGLLIMSGCGTQAKSDGSTQLAKKQVLNWTESSELATANLSQANRYIEF